MCNAKENPKSIVHHYYYHNESQDIIRYFEKDEEWFIDKRQILTCNQQRYELLDYGILCNCKRRKTLTKTKKN